MTVTALNSPGQVNTAYTGTVHFASTDPLAVLPADYTFTSADQGVHSFTVTLKRSGHQQVTATDTVTTSLTATASVQVQAGVASSFVVAGFPSPVTAGAAGNLTVTALDTFGNIATGYVGKVHFTSTDAKAVLPSNYKFTAADAGSHTFSITLETAGTQSLTATDTATAGITGTQSGITVHPAAASALIVTSSSSVTLGVAFSITVTAVDAYGNVATGYAGTVEFTSSDKKAGLPANYTFTTSDQGVHTFTGVVLNTKGSQKITVVDILFSSIDGSTKEDVM